MQTNQASGRAVWRRRWLRFRRRYGPFVASFTLLGLLIMLWNRLMPEPPPLSEREFEQTVVQIMASATPAPARSSQVFQIIQPSLVLIQVGRDQSSEHVDGLGTGVVVDQQGSILTSLHVVDGAERITVTFADGTESLAEVITRQPENDIAVLITERLPELLIPAVLGNPNRMQVGDEAFVVGHPLGLYASMSSGVISGFDRSFRPEEGPALEGLIQIDAAVNPGNSGGPLLNRAGQVIGIVTGLVNPTEHDVFIGIGLAVPITVAGGAAGLPPY